MVTQLCTIPSRRTVMNLRGIVAAWPRILHLFFKPKMRETPETVMAFQLGIVARWKKCWISFFSFVRRLWNSGLRFFDEFSNVPQLQEQRSLCDQYFHEQYSKALGLCAWFISRFMKVLWYFSISQLFVTKIRRNIQVEVPEINHHPTEEPA